MPKRGTTSARSCWRTASPPRRCRICRRRFACARYAEAHYNLARALAALGRFAEAIDEATIAEQQARVVGKTALTAQIRDDLQRYRASVKP